MIYILVYLVLKLSLWLVPILAPLGGTHRLAGPPLVAVD